MGNGTKTKDELSAVIIRHIPRHLHNQFKCECAKSGWTMREVLIAFMGGFRANQTKDGKAIKDRANGSGTTT